MKPKIIKTEQEHEEALKRIEEIFFSKPGTPEGEELELLVLLVDDYEARTTPIAPPDPLSAIKFQMDQMGLKPKDLLPYFKSPSRVSEVLNGKRGLSLDMIRKLYIGLNIPAEILIGQIVHDTLGVSPTISKSKRRSSSRKLKNQHPVKKPALA